MKKKSFLKNGGNGKKQRGTEDVVGSKPLNRDDPPATVALKIPMRLLERLDAVAEQNGWNRSQAIREAIHVLLESSKWKRS